MIEKNNGRHAGETDDDRAIRLSNYHIRLIASRNKHETNVKKRKDALVEARAILEARGENAKSGRQKHIAELTRSIADSATKISRLTVKIIEVEDKILPKSTRDGMDW